MTLSRGISLGAGSLLLAYGLFSLRAGWVISTWGRLEYRPGAIYWITVVALIVIGGVNVALGVKALVRPANARTETHPGGSKEDSASPPTEQVK